MPLRYQIQNVFSSPPSSGGGAGLIKLVTVLSSADLNGLQVSFLPVTETPPGGSRIIPAWLSANYKFGGVDYGATGTFTFFWGTTPGAFFAYRQIGVNGFLNPGTGIDQCAQANAVNEADSGTAIPRNLSDGAPVVVGNPAAIIQLGNGTVTLTAFYTIQAFA